jgi:electron transport complex protein RnfB
MVEVTQTTGWSAWSSDQAAEARQRYEGHQARHARTRTEKSERLGKVAQDKLKDLASHSQITDPTELERKRRLIEAALEQARIRRKNRSG